MAKLLKAGNWTLTNDVLGFNTSNISVTIPMTKERLQDIKCLLNMDNELKQPKLVGYQCEVNGDFFDFNGMLLSFQIFSSPMQIQKWLNAYGTLCKLDERSIVKVINIYEGDVEDYSFVGECEDKATEFCNYCDAEVEIANRFIPQICPNCGEILLPCNMCFDCQDCPFCSDTCKTKYFKNWAWNIELEGFILE